MSIRNYDFQHALDTISNQKSDNLLRSEVVTEHNHHTVSDATWEEYYPSGWVLAAERGEPNPWTGTDLSKWKGKFNIDSPTRLFQIKHETGTDGEIFLNDYMMQEYHPEMQYHRTLGPDGKEKDLPTPMMMFDTEKIPGWNDIKDPFFWVNVFISFPLPVRLVQAFQQSIDHKEHRIVPGAIKNKAYISTYNSGRWSWNTPRGLGYYPVGAAAPQWEMDLPVAEINWMEFVTAREPAGRTFQSVFLENILKLQGGFVPHPSNGMQGAPDTVQVRIQRLVCFVFSFFLMKEEKVMSPEDWVMLCKILNNALTGYDTFQYGKVGMEQLKTLMSATDDEDLARKVSREPSDDDDQQELDFENPESDVDKLDKPGPAETNF